MTQSGQETIYRMVTEKILEQLDKGTVPWHRPWAGGTGAFPMSMSTGRPYRGVNLLLLGMSGFGSPWWGTENKIGELCGMTKVPNSKHWVSPDGAPRGVREGERYTFAIFWRRIPVWVLDEDTGKPKKKRVPMIRYYRVFNAEQCDSLPDKYLASAEEVPGTFAEHREADVILKGYLARDGAPSLAYGGSRAYWQPGTDAIHVPPLTAYESPAEAYSTLFHELAHSTGHKSRLNRPENVNYSDGLHNKPKEEMCAELTSAMLLGVAGIDDMSAFDNSASYIDGWRRRISKDVRLVVNAAAQAQHAADHILDITFEGGDET